MKFCIFVIMLFAVGCCVENPRNTELLQNTDASGDGNVNENDEGIFNDEDNDGADDIDNNLKRIMAVEGDVTDENFGSESNKSEEQHEKVHEYNQTVTGDTSFSGTIKKKPTDLESIMKDNGRLLSDKINQIELLREQIESRNSDMEMKDIDPAIKKDVLETEFNLPANKWGNMDQAGMLHQLESYYRIKPQVTEETAVKKTAVDEEPNLVDDPSSIGGGAMDRTVNKAKDLKKQLQDEDDEDISYQPPAVKKIKEDAENALQIEEAKDKKKSTDELVEKIQNTKENVIKDDHLDKLFNQNREADEMSLDDKESKATLAAKSAAAAITDIVPEYKYALSEGADSSEYQEHIPQTRADQVKSYEQKEKDSAMRKAVDSIPIFDSNGKADVDDINMDGIRSLTNVDEADEFEDIEVLGDDNEEVNIGGRGDVGMGNVQEIVRRRKRNINTPSQA